MLREQIWPFGNKYTTILRFELKITISNITRSISQLSWWWWWWWQLNRGYSLNPNTNQLALELTSVYLACLRE